jgi:hypothetical protein
MHHIGEQDRDLFALSRFRDLADRGTALVAELRGGAKFDVASAAGRHRIASAIAL